MSLFFCWSFFRVIYFKRVSGRGLGEALPLVSLTQVYALLSSPF